MRKRLGWLLIALAAIWIVYAGNKPGCYCDDPWAKITCWPFAAFPAPIFCAPRPVKNPLIKVIQI